jgi:hypothetical protein
MKSPRNPYSPPQSNLEGTKIKDISKPVWPYVRDPYSIPCRLMVLGLLMLFLLRPFGMAAVSGTCFWAGILSWVYAYRKQPVHRAEERIWWSDFHRKQKRG